MNLSILVAGVCVLLGTDTAAKKEVESVVEQAFAPLPGDHAFVFTELTDNGPKLLFGSNEDERFAIGSSFKLFILGTLADEVNTGLRRLENTTLLDKNYVGPPHSEMAEWPMGSPVTLHTLALKMIWISDNTATDHLLHLLGRERVEQQMGRMGHSKPEVNRPLLSTREMTMLRDKNAGLPGRKYQTLDTQARRKFLADLTGGSPDYEKLDFDTAEYKLAEWYATPMDMARAMAWLKSSTETNQPAHSLRAVMSVDTKLPHDANTWPYVGFKGGSEDQLLAGNWLLKNRDGRWFTFHVFYNRPDGKVNMEKMLKAVEQIFRAIEKQL